MPKSGELFSFYPAPILGDKQNSLTLLFPVNYREMKRLALCLTGNRALANYKVQIAGTVASMTESESGVQSERTSYDTPG
jgi:hypothetical protein